ncbi:hypothetical protein KAR91_56850 [Candidatus Pacearchaeota archaeon]|nr:hypothetical protein [Candidatus Pacearchaeota archaeon]
MVKQWAALQPRQQVKITRECVKDVRRFYRNPYMLNIEPYPFQDDISYKLIHDNSVRDAICLLGMRSGKTTLGGAVSAYYLFRMSLLRDPASHYGLIPGSPIRMTNMATSKDQGKETIFDFFRLFVETAPYYKDIPDLELQVEKIILHDRNFKAISLSSASGSSVGKTSVITCFDEADLFEDTERKDGIQQVWSRVTKATKTLRKLTHGEIGKTLTISSLGEFPVGGFMERMIEKAKVNDHMIWVKLTTWDANPLYTIADFKEDFGTDYAGAMRDFGCDARAVASTYVKNERICQTNSERPNFFEWYFGPDRNKDQYRVMEPGEYYLTGDPSLKRDAFGIALGHSTGKRTEILLQREKETEIVFLNDIVIDGLWRLKPSDYKGGEIDPAHVEEIFLDISTHIPITNMVFDTWAFPILQAKAKRLGIIVENQMVRVPECDALKDYMQYGAIDICWYPQFTKEAMQLQLSNNGKRVDHPKGGSKDVWDAVALQVYAAHEINQLHAPWNPAIAVRF